MIMDINQTIQSTLLKACSGTTSNVFYYLVAVSKEFASTDTIVTYELNNTENVNVLELKNAIRMYDVIVKVTSSKQSTIANLNVFIITNLSKLAGGNIGYITLTSQEQPTYQPENTMYSSTMTFNLQWLS